MNVPDYPLEYLLVHRAIHDRDVNEVALGQVIYEVKTNKDKLRNVNYWDSKLGKYIYFIEQNPKKFSGFAVRARAGEKITWGIHSGPWMYIDEKVAKELAEKYLV